jgi:tetratricopeptide (TPR) repeat protein
VELSSAETVIACVSVLSLIFSIVSLGFSLNRNRIEDRRLARAQLTEAMGKIISVFGETAKLGSDVQKGPAYVQAVTALLGHEQNFYLQQAMTLERRFPSLVTSVEYRTLAFANVQMGNYPAAEEYHLKGLSVSSGALEEVMSRRAYAHLLFLLGRFDDARRQYTEALSLFKVRDNQGHYQCGQTYQFWGVNEMNFARLKNRANEAFESAERQFTAIDSEQFKHNSLVALEQATLSVGLATPRAGEGQLTAPTPHAATQENR